MPTLEFTDGEFDQVLNNAKALYAATGQVRCPYFQDTVHFTPRGLEHLRRKAWNRGRSRRDQFMRLKFLSFAPEILLLSHTVQGIWHAHDRVRRHRHGHWEEDFLPAIFYEFVAVLKDRRFKVIVRKTEGQEREFWSLIPFWRRTEQGSRLLHDGNPAED